MNFIRNLANSLRACVSTRCRSRSRPTRTRFARNNKFFAMSTLARLTFPKLRFSFRVFNKVKSRSAHMKSHRPIPLPDSTAQESKRPTTQQLSKAQQQLQPQPTPLHQGQQQQQQQQLDNATPQAQDHQQQLPASISDNSAHNTAHLCHNPTRPP